MHIILVEKKIRFSNEILIIDFSHLIYFGTEWSLMDPGQVNRTVLLTAEEGGGPALGHSA